MPRKTNYQTFYPTQFPSLLDPNVGQPTGYVTKDGVEHFSKNFECAMTYIKKGIQKEKKDARSKLTR